MYVCVCSCVHVYVFARLYISLCALLFQAFSEIDTARQEQEKHRCRNIESIYSPTTRVYVAKKILPTLYMYILHCFQVRNIGWCTDVITFKFMEVKNVLLHTGTMSWSLWVVSPWHCGNTCCFSLTGALF